MTGTMQPDPQVVACPDCDGPAGELCRNDRGAAVAWIHLGRRDRALEPQPLTVADIPAGQGPASLYLRLLRPDSERLALWFKDSAGESVLLQWQAPSHPGEAAIWDHLVATLPTVTTEETP